MPMKFFQKKVGGKYQLGKTIGRGHFSKVKDAVHVKTKIRFAVKAVDKKVLQEEQMEEQLKREIALMRRLNHPSIVRLYEVFTTKTTIYLVLELVLGGELFNRIVEEKRFSEDVARTYFQQLLIGTYYCHCHGIAHRDLKPENLLLDQQNHLKITDFGLSTLQPNYKGTVMHGMELKTMCGSPEYVAPEILQGSGYSGFTADVWACGVILYVMISGSLPFVDTETSTMFDKIKSADYVMYSFFSAAVQDLLRHILLPNPAERYTLEAIFTHEWVKPGLDVEEIQRIKANAFIIDPDAQDLENAMIPLSDDLSLTGDNISSASTNTTATSSSSSSAAAAAAAVAAGAGRGGGGGGGSGGAPQAPMSPFGVWFERIDQLTMHRSYGNPEFVEKKSNLRFGVQGMATDVLNLLCEVLQAMGAHTDNKKDMYTIKVTKELGGTALTFALDVMQSSDPNITVVEARRGRGTIMTFHPFYREMLEKVRDRTVTPAPPKDD